MGRWRAACGVLAVGICLLAAAPAQAAKSCGEPGSQWQRATPAEAGMDAAKLQQAIDYGSENLSFAVRVYRYGCLVGQDRAAAVNDSQTFESWSMAKSVTSLIFGRAMTMRAISPDDPIGALLPESDRAHGRIAARNLLTQTSGLKWNGLRDYNIFTTPDRVRDALTLPGAHTPGTYFEYAQSPVALLAEQVGRSVGEDVQAFGQRELMSPLGIPASAWSWKRDKVGHVEGFYGVQMRPDDYGRLGELLRRGGVWRGRRLLSKRYVSEATSPSSTNGCYGYLIWVNRAAPCIGPRVTDRPYSNARDFPDLPADMYRFSGLFGQLVTNFPSQGLLVVRTGEDPGLLPAGGAGWEHGLYQRVLASVTDQKIVPPAPAKPYSTGDAGDSDAGFQRALAHPDQYSQGAVQDPLGPAGPPRARAVQPELARSRVSRKRKVTFRLRCPVRWPSKMKAVCRGRASLTGGGKRTRYSIKAGKSKLVRFKLTRKRMRLIKKKGKSVLMISARDADSGGGTLSRLHVTVRRPARR
jgi:CubicO group peptidase (beta-lactamase class C family)